MNPDGPNINGPSQSGGMPGNQPNNNGRNPMSIDFMMNRNDEDNDNQPWINQPLPTGSKPHYDSTEFYRHYDQALQLDDRERNLNTELKDNLKTIHQNHETARKRGVPYYQRPSKSAIGVLDQEKHNLLCRQAIEYARNKPGGRYHHNIDWQGTNMKYCGLINFNTIKKILI